MLRMRHFALLRILASLVLLWVGFDLGAHGLFASDFTPMTTGGSSLRLNIDDGEATAPIATDHCFCRGASMGAVAPAPAAGLTPAGTVVVAPSFQVPLSDVHPLDRPPQLTA
jgi:hypothetical protein